MQNELFKNIFNKSGVVVTEYSQNFVTLLEKLHTIFLKNGKLKDDIIKKLDLENVHYFLQNKHLYWELFRFHNVKALEDEQAIQAFIKKKISECFLVQLPSYNLQDNPSPAYHIVGEYDFNFINSMDDFLILQEEIKKQSPIPFFVFDNIREEIGDELYIFDNSLSWVLMLTHPKDIFFYQIDM